MGLAGGPPRGVNAGETNCVESAEDGNMSKSSIVDLEGIGRLSLPARAGAQTAQERTDA